LSCQLPGNGRLAPATRGVDVAHGLDVQAGALVLARVQVTAVPPVERRHQGAVEEDDLPRHLVGEVLGRAAEGIGEELCHQVRVPPRGGRADPEVLTRLGEGEVASQPAQTQPQRLDHRQRLRAASCRVPAGELLFCQLDDELGRADAQPG
jgi:hypothetical protein